MNEDPDVEAIVKRYDTPTGGSTPIAPHPFAGEYTRLQEPIVIKDKKMPCDLVTLCRTAKAQLAPTYAFMEGHRYDLTSLRDIMELDSAIQSIESTGERIVSLKAKGHGSLAIYALTNIYHAFIADPNAAVDYVENGDA